MKKFVKTLVAALATGSMCISAFALTACDGKTVEVPGKSAYEIAVDNGFEGTEEEWLASLRVTTPGKSAYEIAVDNGFEGTEAEWLESLNVSVPTTVRNTETSYSVNADGKTVLTVKLTMSDGSVQTKEIVLPHSVVSASMYESVIMTREEAKSLSNLTGLVWSVTYDDGSSGEIPARASQIKNIEPYSNDGSQDTEWDGTFVDGRVYILEMLFAKHGRDTATVYVYICDDISTISEYADDNYYLRCPSEMQAGDAFDLKTVFLAKDYRLSEKLNETYGGQYIGDSSMTHNIPVTEEMLSAPVDMSTSGRKEVSVTYNGNNYNGSIDVYDIEESVVDSLYVQGDDLDMVTITAGGDLDEAFTRFIGADLYVRYYVYVNGNQSETVKITEEMLDLSGVNVNNAGSYNAKINYGGAFEEIPVLVLPDMTEATVEKSITGMGMTIFALMGGGVVSKVDLYDNGYCEVFVTGEGGEVSTVSEMGYLPYTLTGTTLEVKYNDEKVAIFTVDADNNTFAAYAFSPDSLTATYSGNMDGVAFTLKLYENGFGTLTADIDGTETTFVVGYAVDDTTITIAPSTGYMVITFTIVDDDTVTMHMQISY